MLERIFKKRLLVIAPFNNSVHGVNTFFHNMFKIYDECDVCIDILNLSPSKEKIIVNDYGIIGNVYDLWEGLQDLKALEYKQMPAMFPFLEKVGVHCCTALSSFAIFHAIFNMLQRNIYDAIFNNNNGQETVQALFQYFPITSIIPVYEYGHDAKTWITKPYKNVIKNNLHQMKRAVREAVAENYTLFTQCDQDYKELWGAGIHAEKMGMLLECEKFREYQLPESEKEDRVLYIGRWDKMTKNPDLWFKVMADIGLPGLVIVPSEKNACEAAKYAQEYGLKDCEIYHSLTFEEKMKQSARCKCFFTSSKMETFGYTIYENMSLMPVVAPNEPWAHMVKKELPFLRVAGRNGAKVEDLVRESVQGYSDAYVEEQYKDVLRYRNECKEKWSTFLKTGMTVAMGKESEKEDPKIIKLLEKHNTLPEAILATGRKFLGWEEIDVLYKHLHSEKLVQTKNTTYYGKISEEKRSGNKGQASLDAFFG